MLRRIVGWIVLVPLSVVLIVFALANRQLVVVNFNPFVPTDALASPGVGVPFFLVLFGVLLLGVVLGGIATWFAQAPHRRDERAYRRESERLNRELEAIRRAPSLPGAGVDDLVKP
ncbi:MAG: lipopolysaccharide assembly protein LapA domain-containing protein [Devosia sp.]